MAASDPRAPGGTEPATVETGLPQKDRKLLAHSVAKALAETYVLYTKTQAVHWNVTGPLFYSLHKLTEKQYEDLGDAIDELAERIRALDAPAPGSFGEFLELSDIRENRERQTAEQGVLMLCADHATAARTFREATRLASDFEDVVTADLLTERMAFHEKSAWMLRALIQESGVEQTRVPGAGRAPPQDRPRPS